MFKISMLFQNIWCKERVGVTFARGDTYARGKLLHGDIFYCSIVAQRYFCTTSHFYDEIFAQQIFRTMNFLHGTSILHFGKTFFFFASTKSVT